ncbi:MAG TPA: peptidase C45, partial [Nakamurella sp.]
GTAFVGPDMPVEFATARIATNHRGDTPEYPERAARLRSVPRRNRLTAVLATDPRPADLAAAFLADPLYNRDYSRSFGTLYTALYRPAQAVAEFVWPGQSWRRGFDDPDGTRQVVLVGQ